MESFIVYSHVNKLNNITYIGITKREPKLRWTNGFGYKKYGEQLKTFNSIKEASEYVGKPKLHSKISDCCNGKRNKTCGYKWKYAEQ